MIIVGAGRVGTALHERCQQAGGSCTLVDRHRGWEALDGPQGDPILLAVRNDDLVEVMERVPGHRRQDLVFLQNGAVRDFLRERTLSNCTRGLLYFAVAAHGDPITPGRTSWFCGGHGGTVAHWMGALGLEASNVDWARFSFYELEKLCWLSSMGVLCQVHQTTVGEIATRHRTELSALVGELQGVGRITMGVDVPHDYLLERICDYSLSIRDYRASVKEWPWRNGWFVAQARRFQVAMPVHQRLLESLGLATNSDSS